MRRAPAIPRTARPVSAGGPSGRQGAVARLLSRLRSLWTRLRSFDRALMTCETCGHRLGESEGCRTCRDFVTERSLFR